MYPRVSRSSMLTWTLDRYTFAKLNTNQWTYHLHPFAMYVHTCHCDHWHHASPFFCKTRAFCPRARELLELMALLIRDACLITQLLKRRPWLEKQFNKFWRFNVAFPKHSKKHVLMKLVFIGLVFFDGMLPGCRAPVRGVKWRTQPTEPNP